MFSVASTTPSLAKSNVDHRGTSRELTSQSDRRLSIAHCVQRVLDLHQLARRAKRELVVGVAQNRPNKNNHQRADNYGCNLYRLTLALAELAKPISLALT